MDMTMVVTGHYARIEKREDGRYLLKKAADPAKDQSYVLYSLTQEQLAERLQVSRQAVSKWENGQTAPDLDNIIAMSNLYEVTTDYILIGKERVPKEKEQKRRKRKSGILCLAAGVVLTPLFAKLYQGWMFATEGSSYTNSLYYLTELPMLGVTVLAVAGIVIGIWLLKKE